MCHLLCFLTGAGLATYLSRRRYRREVEAELDNYDRQVRGVTEHTPLTMPVPDPNPTGDNPSNTLPRSPQETWEVEQMAARRRDVGNSIGTAVESVLEFFENLGDSVSPKKQPQKKEKAQSPEEALAQAPPLVDQKFAEPPPRV